MLGPKELAMAVMAVMVISLVAFTQESLDAVAKSVPLCVFTVSGGLLLMWRGPHALYQLAGVMMATSPFWLMPVFDRAVAAVMGVF